MCTAITYRSGDSYFGRNLDLEYSYNETVTVTPRNYPFTFRRCGMIKSHYAMIGIAYVQEGYPLYYDAVNEHGLSMAGLNFPGNAHYFDAVDGKDNISPFEFIPWVLCQCKTIADARGLLSRINLWRENFSPSLPLSPLHWIIADKNEAITVESVADGLKIYDNKPGVLTNNPSFDFMMQYLSTFRDLSASPSENKFTEKLDLPVFCQGLGAIGLPGDYSSPSRFVKAAFVKLNGVSLKAEPYAVSQFFHILSSVEMPRGCVALGSKKYDITVYSSCCNQDKGIYYYMTYDTRHINAVYMHRENLDGNELVSYPLINDMRLNIQN